MSELADDSDQEDLAHEMEQSGFHEQYISPDALIASYDATLARSRWRAFINPEQAPVLLIALNTFANGLVGLFQPLFQRLSQHPRFYDIVVPYGIYHWSRSLSLFFGFTLVLLSLNLIQRKKMSWLLSCVGLGVSLLVHVLRARIEYRSDSDFVTETLGFAFIPIILNLVLLILYRKRFSVKSEKKKIKTGVFFLLLSLLTALAYGTLGFYFLDKRDFGIDFQLHDALIRTLREFLLIGNPDINPQTRHAVWFVDSLRLSGVIAGLFAAYCLFRPIEYELRTRPVEHKLARDILEQSGADALDYYKLLRDKSYIFSASRNCFVAYKTVFGIAVALGDVVGKEKELPDFLKAYLAWCHENSWSVAFMQTSERWLPLYKQNSLQALKVGEDAVVDLRKFESSTIKKKDFKGRVRKFEKDSYSFKRFDAPHSLEFLTQLEEVSNEWLSVPGRRERSFSLGMFDRNALKHDNILQC